MPRRRWLALLVHPRDVLGPASRRSAVERALRSGALDVLQLRCTESDSDEQAVAAGEILADLVATHGERAPELPSVDKKRWTRLVVNHGSLELAMGVGANGWHLKERLVVGRPEHELQRDISVAKSQHVIVGCSVHSVEAAIFAAKCGFDYIQVGTMFSTASHPEKAHASQLEGPELLRRIRDAWEDVNPSVKCPPLVAVGGINTKDHVSQVMAEGANGVAVIRGILTHEHPEDAARAYRQWLDEWL